MDQETTPSPSGATQDTIETGADTPQAHERFHLDTPDRSSSPLNEAQIEHQIRLQRYERLNGFAPQLIAVNIGIIILLLVLMGNSLAWVSMANELDRMYANANPVLYDVIREEYSAAYRIEIFMGIGIAFFLLAQAVIMIRLKLASLQNMEPLGVQGWKLSRREVLQAWLIPGLQLYTPPLQLQKIICASQPDPNHQEHVHQTTHALTFWWWYGGLALMIGLLISAILPFTPVSTNVLFGLMMLRLLLLLMCITWAAVGMHYATQIPKYQHLRYQQQLPTEVNQFSNYDGMQIRRQNPYDHIPAYPSTPAPLRKAPMVLPENPEYTFHLMLSAPMNGPFQMSEIYHHLKSGNVHGRVLCRRDHDTEFTALREIEEFQWMFKKTP